MSSDSLNLLRSLISRWQICDNVTTNELRLDGSRSSNDDSDQQHLASLKFLYSLKTCKYYLIFSFFQIEGEVEKDSEVRATYKDLHAKVWSLTYINTLYFTKN